MIDYALIFAIWVTFWAVPLLILMGLVSFFAAIEIWSQKHP